MRIVLWTQRPGACDATLFIVTIYFCLYWPFRRWFHSRKPIGSPSGIVRLLYSPSYGPGVPHYSNYSYFSHVSHPNLYYLPYHHTHLIYPPFIHISSSHSRSSSIQNILSASLPSYLLIAQPLVLIRPHRGHLRQYCAALPHQLRRSTSSSPHPMVKSSTIVSPKKQTPSHTIPNSAATFTVADGNYTVRLSRHLMSAAGPKTDCGLQGLGTNKTVKV